MSKEAATRAMREARYAERMARAATPAAAAARAARKTAPVAPPVAPSVRTGRSSSPAADVSAPAGSAGVEALCGHRSMNGRTCTRELGHAAKNHRYS